MEPPSCITPFTPLNGSPSFPTWLEALEDDCFAGEELRTLLELRICAIAGEIRDGLEWWTKLSDISTVSSWLEDMYCPEWPESPEDNAMVRNALGEERWQASVYPGPARPVAAYGTFSIDRIPTDVVSKLLAGVENVLATTRRDVRPGSYGLVVDLVHPSMYAYEQRVTAVLGDASVKKAPPWDSFIGKGTARREENFVNIEEIWVVGESGLAWLPSEFSVSASGEKCSINSYINSLRPRQNEEMYDAVAEAFVVALALFEEELNFIGKGNEPWEMPLRFSNEVNWASAGEWGHVPHPPGRHPFRNDAHSSSEMHEGKSLIIPKVRLRFRRPILPPRAISLKEKDLQVIVKLASIELTPEQPYYGGCVWQLEGMRNDRIVATTCLYLEVENLNEPRIQFRTAVPSPVEPDDYDKEDFLGVKRLLGLDHEGPMV